MAEILPANTTVNDKQLGTLAVDTLFA